MSYISFIFANKRDSTNQKMRASCVLRRIALMFPGQGAQRVGMARDLAHAFPAARAVLEEVDEALGMRLSQLMFEGPEVRRLAMP